MRYVKLTVCWLLKLNPGQLDRGLGAWSSRLKDMVMVKWTAWYYLVNLNLLGGGESLLVK